MNFHNSKLFCSATEYVLIRVHHILTTFGINLLKPTGYVMHHQFNTLRTGEADLRF